MRKGTVVYIGGFEMPDKNAAAHRVLNNAKVLQLLGYHVVFCGIDHGLCKNATNVSKIGSFDNIPAAYPKSNLGWAKQLVDFSHIKETFNRYNDVKYAIAYNMHAIPLARLLHYSKKKKIKVIADVTEWYENKLSLNPIKIIKCLDTFFVMHFLQKKVDSIIAISSLLTNFYKNSVKNIITVPPLVDLSDPKWNDSDVTKDSCLEFVYSGVPGAGTKKDLLGRIIQAFGQLKKDLVFKFTIIGLTKDQFINAFPECKKELNELGEKVVFKGRVSHQESIASLFKADYCIFIRNRSRKNMAGFPTKFVECYTSGIGIIANDVSDIAMYFPDDGKSCLMNDFSVATLKRIFDEKINMFDNERMKKTPLRSLFDIKNYVDIFQTLI